MPFIAHTPLILPLLIFFRCHAMLAAADDGAPYMLLTLLRLLPPLRR